MTKYIHKSYNRLSDIIVSDNPDPERDGYSIFMEIDIDDFQAVIDAMNSFDGRLVKLTLKEDGTMNTSGDSFLHSFLNCLTVRENLEQVPFEIKIHHDSTVMVYSRTRLSV